MYEKPDPQLTTWLTRVEETRWKYLEQQEWLGRLFFGLLIIGIAVSVHTRTFNPDIAMSMVVAIAALSAVPRFHYHQFFKTTLLPELTHTIAPEIKLLDHKRISKRVIAKSDLLGDLGYYVGRDYICATWPEGSVEICMATVHPAGYPRQKVILLSAPVPHDHQTPVFASSERYPSPFVRAKKQHQLIDLPLEQTGAPYHVFSANREDAIDMADSDTLSLFKDLQKAAQSPHLYASVHGHHLVVMMPVEDTLVNVRLDCPAFSEKGITRLAALLRLMPKLLHVEKVGAA